MSGWVVVLGGWVARVRKVVVAAQMRGLLPGWLGLVSQVFIWSRCQADRSLMGSGCWWAWSTARARRVVASSQSASDGRAHRVAVTYSAPELIMAATRPR